VRPALALPTRGAAIEYIGAFGVGTIVAMTAFAAVMGSAGARVHHRAALHRGMMLTAATLAIAVGGFWLIF
jgi:divalent metal cation (Fe/Co/Zn/Cd) transporter